MMGQHSRMESLFYYFRLEEQIPEDHLLRLIDRYVDLSFVRERRPVRDCPLKVTVGLGSSFPWLLGRPYMPSIRRRCPLISSQIELQ